MADPENANPTILNAADLPTRRRRPSSSNKASDATQGIFSIPSPSSYLSTSSFLDNTFSDASHSDHSVSDISDEDGIEPIDTQEIYDLISTISDPEHPLSLGSLAVVNLPDISIKPILPNRPSSTLQTVTVLITPTITHCSLATVIGLGVRVRLEQSLPPRYRVDVKIKEGTHSTAEEVNKQLGDKERVAAALENSTLMGVIKKMLETCI
ncbi:putative cytoplasmic protein required for cell [Phaeomoniella chlamydospora]|uniref:Putative cytoplasmic protein required for cell n=1 Tax=Phaeomoniella chlamydospora TaxID=158046 RepID=A0A0G2E4U8_PHACM|nr:putative cytoplasmic protein required for cell [Phaeomoniella chlamydospora]